MSTEITKPIQIFRGDDTDAFGLRTLTIKITGDLVLNDATASFSLLNYSKSFDNTTTKAGILTMSFSASDTKNMPLGPAFGTLRLFDSGKRLTVVNTIPFEITNRVFGSPSQEYDINVTLAVDTEINITFKMEGSGSGESYWATSPNNKVLYPVDNRIERVVVPDLADVSEIGTRYTLADVKNLVNTILRSLKM